jgi:GNAT superfamily N-acetyltransferase
MEISWLYDGDYGERLTLADGNRLLIRPIRSTDQQKLAETFRRLSPESRYRRCFSLKKELTPAELHFFTDLDGINHFALAAVLLDDSDSEQEGIGGVRFIRLPEGADSAEVAFLVSDSWQRKGIGRLLLQRLIAAAAERGINKLRCYLLAENSQARHFISDVCWDVSFQNEGTVIAAEFTIDSAAKTHEPTTYEDVLDLLQLAARGYVVAPTTLVSVASACWWKEVRRNLALWNNAKRPDAA